MAALALTTGHADQELDDLDLVARVRAGDDRAFELLFLRYQPRIAAYVRGMVRDHGRAEDVTQEIFMSALRRMRAADGQIAFKPWIYEIARNACIDAYRRGRHTVEVSFDAHDAIAAGAQGRLAGPAGSPAAAVEGKLAIENLRGAFGGLSQVHHAILVLREFEGLSYVEIGERLGMSRPAVESTLFRARKRLTVEYEEIASGERCQRVQCIVGAGSARPAGLRDRRRMARHLAHCQPCRRYARLAAADDAGTADLRPRAVRGRAAARVAAFLPLPMLLRRRTEADDGGAVLGQHGGRSLPPWSAHVAGMLDPGPLAGWAKVAATVATVAVAGLGAGAAINKRDAGGPARATDSPGSQAAAHARPAARTNERTPSSRGGGDRSTARDRAARPLPAAASMSGAGPLPAATAPRESERTSRTGAQAATDDARQAGRAVIRLTDEVVDRVLNVAERAVRRSGRAARGQRLAEQAGRPLRDTTAGVTRTMSERITNSTAALTNLGG